MAAQMAAEKVALVTAGGSGMGAGAARRLAADGFRIAILSSSGKGEALAAELGGLGVTGSNKSNDDLKRLVDAITTVKERVKFCTVCGNVTEQELCNICRDPRRDPTVICVVEESKDVLAVERTRSFRGRYHVLGGAINPIAGIGPEQLRIRELLTRLNDGAIQEIIIATDPNLEGEATATYLARMLKSIGIAVTRLASGLPVGGDLEYADEVTLGRAFEGRRNALS